MSRRPLKRGSLIADYTILDVLAEDSLGYAYVATTDETSDDPSLLRVLREYFPANLAKRSRDSVSPMDSEQKARLFRSGLARARGYQIEAGKLTNPALVRTGGALDENDTTYSVEVISPTHTLGGFVAERGPISPVNVRSLLLFLAQGLEDLAQNDLVHGAISADTVLRNDVGQFLLTSLEHTQISKLSRADGQQLRNTTAYSAPELTSGSIEEVGPWTDIYGLGAIAHMALLGKPPPDMRTRKNAGMTPFFGPSETPAETKFHAFLTSCLDLSTVNRPQSASAFRNQLLEIEGLAATRIGGKTAVAPLPTRRPPPDDDGRPTRSTAAGVLGNHRNLVIGGAAALVILLGAGLLSLGGNGNDQTSSQTVDSELSTPSATGDGSLEAALPDGTTPPIGAVDPFAEDPTADGLSDVAPESDEELREIAERREWLALDREDPLAVRDYLTTAQSPEMVTFAQDKLAALDREAWDRAVEGGQIGDYQTYLEDFGPDAVPPGAFAARADAAITDLSEEAENLEQETRRQLLRLGYSLEDEVVADKRRLTAAVRRYQSAQNLQVNGELSRTLLTDIANTIAAAEEATRLAEVEARQAELAAERAAEEAAAREAQRRREAAEAALRARQEAEAEAAAEAAAAEPPPEPGSTFTDCATCPTMVVLPTGSYRQGSPSSESARLDNEGPMRQVALDQQIAVSQTEITVANFRSYLTATGRTLPGQCASESRDEPGVWSPVDGRSFASPGYRQSGNHPAVCVTWSDAKRYVEWLSDETGETYRLLSEAEWEYAARGGSRSPYPWGSNPRESCNHGNVADRSAERSRESWEVAQCRDGNLYPTDVAEYRPNGFGLYDMIGNVWEWVEDCYASSYANVASDGTANTSTGCRYRVIRGGSWASSPDFLRSAYRSSDLPTARYDMLGLRVAREL